MKGYDDRTQQPVRLSVTLRVCVCLLGDFHSEDGVGVDEGSGGEGFMDLCERLKGKAALMDRMGPQDISLTLYLPLLFTLPPSPTPPPSSSSAHLNTIVSTIWSAKRSCFSQTTVNGLNVQFYFECAHVNSSESDNIHPAALVFTGCSLILDLLHFQNSCLIKSTLVALWHSKHWLHSMTH